MGPFLHGPLFHGPFLHTIWPALIIVASIAIVVTAWTFAPRRGIFGACLGQDSGPRFAGVADGFGAGVRHRGGWRPFATDSKSNAAFDEWRAAEVAKLEDERRRLEAAHQEFAAFVENLRRAEERAEFDRFINVRRAPANPSG